MIINKFKKWFYIKIDNYIIKNHAEDYIRRSLIQDEILKQIQIATRINDKMRDEQEDAKLKSQKLNFDILEAGWCAEIENMENQMREVSKWRSELEDLHYRTFSRAKELAIITAESNHEGKQIITKVAASLGKLDPIGMKADDLVKEFEENKIKDEQALRIK